MKGLAIMTADGMIAAAPVLAGTEASNSAPLHIYACMAKLEANMAEAAGAVMIGAMAGGNAEIRTEAREDFNSDAGQIENYVATLRATPLNGEQTQALESFVSQWEPIAEAGRNLLASEDDDIQQAAFEWWQSLDGLDDLIDDQLEAILEAQGIELSS